MAYRSDDRSDRWKAIGGVLAVHVVLGAVIITGLNVEIISRAVERLETFDISIDQPPPEEPPPPKMEAERAPEEAGAPGRRADPTPVVAPEPKVRLPIQSPVAAARVPGTGTSSSSGAGTAGTGTGAGGTGSGRGGGGAGAGSGLGSPPRLVSGGPTRADYRRLGARIRGKTQAILRLTISPDGRIADCRLVRSTGYPDIDARLCPLLQPRMRWAPARDRAGVPTTNWLDYVVPITRTRS